MTNHKVAIIMGGSSGIGRATAVALAKEGTKIVVAARRVKEGEETVRLVKEAGSDGIFVKADVANENDIKSLVDKTAKTYGRLDYAFNNAGIAEDMMSFADQKSNIFDNIMNINVKGVWHAVLGLTKSAALEYAKSGIRINAVAPGAIQTDMYEQVVGDNKQIKEALSAMHPIGRTGKPDEIADVVAWLLSDKASFIVGHTLLADGGVVSR